MAGQNQNYQENRPRNRRWFPILMIIAGLYVLNHLALFAIGALVLLVGFLFLTAAYRMIQAKPGEGINVAGLSIDPAFIDSARGGLSRADGFIRDLLTPQSEPPFSSMHQKRSLSVSAENAMNRAGWSFDHSVWLSDVGLLAYRGKKAQLYRDSSIPSNVSHVRPFMVMEVPWGVKSDVLAQYSGIRFNLIDAQGKLRFTARQRYILKPGQNFLTPDTWLPIEKRLEDLIDLQNNQFDGQWELQALAGQAVIAEHIFGWRHVDVPETPPLTADGEINVQAQEWLQDEPQDAVSLEDLMAEQARDERETRRASHAGTR